MHLLVIGLVAVIIAVLVAVFLSRRRRHDDEDEPGGRPSVRDRLRGRGGDPRDRSPRDWPGRSDRGPPPGGPWPSTRPASRRDTAARGGTTGRLRPVPRLRAITARLWRACPDRGHDEQRTERIPGARRGGRYDDAPEPVVRPRPGGPAGRPGRARGRGRHRTGPGPRSTTPARPPRTATPPRSQRRPGPGGLGRLPPGAGGHPRTEQGTPAEPGQDPRGRPSRGKHDDDDDWPSTEWDKLSDEQYWAELSADKPLATTARTAQSSSAQASNAQSSSSAAAGPAAARRPGRRPPRPDRDRAAASRTARPAAGAGTGPGRRTPPSSSARGRAAGPVPGRRAARGAQAPEAAGRDARAAGTRPGAAADGRRRAATTRPPSGCRPCRGPPQPRCQSAACTGPMNAAPRTPRP